MYHQSFTCGRCGKPVRKDAVTCPHCGVRFSGLRNANPPAPAKPAAKPSRFSLVGVIVFVSISMVAIALVLMRPQGGSPQAKQKTLDSGSTVKNAPLKPGDQGPTPAAAESVPSANFYERALAGEFGGELVRLWVPSSAKTRYEESLAFFTAKTGMRVEIEAYGDVEEMRYRATKGDVKIAAVNDLGSVAGLARNERLIDPRDILGEAALEERYDPAWLKMASVSDEEGEIMVGIWHSYVPGPVVFYARDNFAAAGYAVPKTWQELIALSDRIVASGSSPWCVNRIIGISQWNAAQWLEEMLLRTQPIQAQKDLAAGTLNSDSPQVKRALEYISSIWFHEGYMFLDGLLPADRDLHNTAKPLFIEPPQCWMYLDGSYMAQYFPETAKYGTDYDWFLLPPVEEPYGRPQTVGGTLIVTFSDLPEVAAVFDYLTRAESVKPWLSSGYSLSPITETPLDWYSDPFQRSLAERKGEATMLTLDPFSLMPEEPMELLLQDLESYSSSGPVAMSGTPMVKRKGNIADLLAEGSISINARGSGIDELELDIKDLIDELLDVEIPAGTYFVSSEGGVQNMVVRTSRVAQVKPGELLSLLLDVACANMEKDVPTNKENFTVLRTGSADLTRLMQAMEKQDVSYDVAQAAVWIVTDNADYDELGTLVTGLGQARVIMEDEAAQAMRLVDDAGIDITTYRIWGYRRFIAKGASQELAEWIAQRERK